MSVVTQTVQSQFSTNRWVLAIFFAFVLALCVASDFAATPKTGIAAVMVAILSFLVIPVAACFIDSNVTKSTPEKAA